MIKRIFKGIKVRLVNLIPIINRKIKTRNWYKNTFPHLYEYDILQQQSDTLCIGSSVAKFSVSFESENIKAYNLAVLPETISYDLKVVKNYHSFLKENGTFLFVLCPFTFLKDKYRKDEDNDLYKDIRYYPIMHRAMLDSFDEGIYRKWVEKPYLLGFRAWLSIFKNPKKMKFLTYETNIVPDNELLHASRSRLDEWKKEFGIEDLNNPILSENIESVIENNVRIFREMISFISERGYSYKVIIPPFPKEITEMIPQEFVYKNLYTPLTKIGVKFDSYLYKTEWFDSGLYVNAFLLNAKGRRLFTHEVLKTINS